MQNKSNILKIGVQKFINLLKKIIQKIKLKIELIDMDIKWGIMGGRCFSLFPPSFYYTHTDEEIERIINELREFMINYRDEDEK